MNRRTFLSAAAAAPIITQLATARTPFISLAQTAAEPHPARPVLGRLKQSVCRWCFGSMKLADLAAAAKGMGIQSIELLSPDEWETVQQAGLTCAVATFVPSNPIARGFNRVEHHDSLVKELEARLPLVKAAGIPNQIVFSGNRDGMDDKQGLSNCAAGLKRLMPLAEQLGVTVIMELLNSRVDHKDYMCDRTAWGVELVNKVASPRFKLLYDIYHMQIMEGDVIRTITDNIGSIGHFHTAGVPGRREIDVSQELNYPAICRAIVEKGFTGYLGQEFMPSRDPLTSLREAVAICDV